MHQLGVHQQQFMHRDDEGEEQQVDPHVEYLQQLVRERCTRWHEDSPLCTVFHARSVPGWLSASPCCTDWHSLHTPVACEPPCSFTPCATGGQCSFFDVEL